MNKSESIAKLAEALSKAQGTMKNAIKDSNNPYFKSTYADLASVSDACRAELAANSLSVTQLPEMRDGRLILNYVLMHSSGEWISGELEMTPVKSDPQGIGSAITYARRYSLASIVGVATEDDDGNAASGQQSARSGAIKDVERTTEDIPIKKNGHAESTSDEPDKRAIPPADQLITAVQVGKVNQRFREALKPELQDKADGLLHDWLGKNLYLDEKGRPSVKMIRKDELETIGPKLMEFAHSL